MTLEKGYKKTMTIYYRLGVLSLTLFNKLKS